MFVVVSDFASELPSFLWKKKKKTGSSIYFGLQSQLFISARNVATEKIFNRIEISIVPVLRFLLLNITFHEFTYLTRLS